MTSSKITNNSVTYKAPEYVGLLGTAEPTRMQNIIFNTGTALQAAGLGLLAVVLTKEFNIASDTATKIFTYGIPITGHLGGTFLRALMKEEFHNHANLVQAKKLTRGNDEEAKRIARKEHFPTLFVKELGGPITDFIPKKFKPA